MKPREIIEALKILYLSHDSGIPYWGTKGASIHVREFTKALRAAGHQVQIAIARTGQGPNGDDGMCCLPDVADPFFVLGGTQGGSSLLSEAKSFARSFVSWTPPCSDFDLVFERYSLFGIAGLSLARQRGVPFVLEVNSPLVKETKQYRTLSLEPLARPIEEYLFSQADCILAVSTAVESHIREVSPGAKVLVLPNGVMFSPSSQPSRPK